MTGLLMKLLAVCNIGRAGAHGSPGIRADGPARTLTADEAKARRKAYRRRKAAKAARRRNRR